jgi:hypothetical protein
VLERRKYDMEIDFLAKDQEKRVPQIFYRKESKNPPKVSDETLMTYFAFLQKNLMFPMKGTYEHETGLFEKTICPITIMKLLDDIDEFYGIFIEGIARKKNEVIPLADFNCTSKDLRNFRLIEDYRTWFWNNK